MCNRISVNPVIETEVIVQNENHNEIEATIYNIGGAIIALLAFIGNLQGRFGRF